MKLEEIGLDGLTILSDPLSNEEIQLNFEKPLKEVVGTDEWDLFWINRGAVLIHDHSRLSVTIPNNLSVEEFVAERIEKEKLFAENQL